MNQLDKLELNYLYHPPPSFPLIFSASKNICLPALYFQSLPSSFVALHIHTCKIRRGAFCIQVPAVSCGMQQLPTEPLYDDAWISWDFATLPLWHYYSTCYSPSSLCDCVELCACLSWYASQCIWPCWLSHILLWRLLAPKLPTRKKKCRCWYM